MLRKRLIVIIVLLPIFVFLVTVGGYVYTGLIGLVMGVAAWEFWHMFRKGGYSPSAAGMIGGAVLLSLRSVFDFIEPDALIAVLLMIMMTIHLVKYEQGESAAPLGFCITAAGALYWGILGGYLIKVRMLPDGLYWFFLVIPAVWAVDGGGYVIGSLFGRHRITPRLSPKKTWEGYFGGFLFGLTITSLLGALWHARAPEITWQRGLLVGGVMALLSILGDVGASMFKRQFNLKDTSNLIPGHGGIIDRIDTWVWAATLGYFLVVQFLYQ